MSESRFMRMLRERAEAEVAPLREYFGTEAPVVRMAAKLLAAAEDVERELNAERFRTSEVAERRRWSPDTLQKYARMKVDGEPLPELWAGLEVDEDPTGFLFVLSSVPENVKAA
jgi:hypothetical protein